VNRVRKPLTEAAKLKMREKAKINYRKKKEAKAKANLITRNEKDVVITSDLIQILKDIEIRKRIYGLRDLVYLTEQANLINKISETIKASNWEDVPKYKWCNYRWWNGAWKTLIWAAITVRLALWDLSKKLMLPVIWHKKNIWIGTASWKNVVETIWKYLLWEYSNTRIPPQFIKKARYDNWILKHLTLINGSQISILTYDQWYEKWQGWNPDFIWLDEDARDHRIWGEAIARTRTNQCNLLMTMTPLNGLTPAVEFFDEPNIEIAHKIHSVLVSSLDNIYTDKSWTKTLTPEEYKMRVEWLAIPPTWIVYNQFSPRENVIEHFNPKELWDPIKYYAAMDFWVNHPTAILFFAVDYDWRVYVYDEIYEKNALLQDLKKKYDEKKWDTHIEYVVADSASARERLELAATW